MKQLPLSVFVVLLVARSAVAQVVFESEDATPPPPPPPSWNHTGVDLRLVSRLSLDTAFEGNNENVAEIYRFATLSLHTDRGPLHLRLTARLRWVTYAESPTPNWHSEFEPSFGESYVSITHWGVDWSAGFLDIAWGQNPAFSPADVLTPIDLRDGPFVGPDSRMPVPAIRARGQFGWLRWDAVYLPVFMPSKFPMYGNDWSPFALAHNPVVPDLSRYVDPSTYGIIESNPIATKLPPVDLSSPQGGLRLSARAGPLDVAVSWAEFVDRQPQLHYSSPFVQFIQSVESGNQLSELEAAAAFSSSLSTQPPFSATYLHTRVFAFDAALTTGKLRWTLDAGYSPLRVFPLMDLTSTVKTMLSGVAGVEFEGPPIIAAGVYTVMALHVGPNERLLMLETNPAPAGVERNVTLTLAYLSATEKLLDDRLVLAFNGLVTEHGDFFLTPSVHWRIRDAHSLGVGAMLIGGPHGGVGAAYHHNNEVFGEYVLDL